MAADILCSFLWRLSYYWRKALGSIRKKKVFLFGALTFMLSSLGAGLSTSFEVLAIFRALQGLGAAFIMPSAVSIVTNTFLAEQERNRAMAILVLSRQ